MIKNFTPLLLGAFHLVTPASAQVTIADTFIFAGDLAIDEAFSLNPGNDTAQGDLFGVDKPLTIKVSGFTSVGTDKLVGVLTLHNSAARVSEVTGLSYGGVDVFSNIVIQNGAGSGNAFSTQIIFYFDNVATDGDLVIDLGATHNVDEAGLALFALNNTQPGLSGADGGNQNPAPLEVSSGDFVIAVSHRNNGTTPTVSAPYTQVDLVAGNMKAGAGYQISTSSGLTAPTFSTGASSVIASFASLEVPQPSAQLLTITPNQSGQGFQLTWSSTIGKTYTLRSSTDLTGDFSTWTFVQENIPASGNGTNIFDVDPAGSKLFYRLEELNAPEP